MDERPPSDLVWHPGDLVVCEDGDYGIIVSEYDPLVLNDFAEYSYKVFFASTVRDEFGAPTGVHDMVSSYLTKLSV